MTCLFGPHKGRIATVTIPGFDGELITRTLEICDQDARILQPGGTKK